MSDERRLLERMVALATDVGKGLGALPDDSARYDMVKGIVGDAEVVFAVWQDRSAKNGVGFKRIKAPQLDPFRAAIGSRIVCDARQQG